MKHPKYADEFLALYDSPPPRPCDGCEYLGHSFDLPVVLTAQGDVAVGQLVCCYAESWGDPPASVRDGVLVEDPAARWEVRLSDEEINAGGVPSWCPLPEPDPVIVTAPPKTAQLSLFDLGGA